MADELGTAVVKIEADLDGLDKGLEKAKDKAGKGADDITKALGAKMTKAGEGLTAGVTAPILGIGGAALKMSTDFNGAMANVATLLPENIDRVNELKGAVQDMAIATGKDTGDLAGGLYQAVSAFGDTADTVDILGINAKAAAAGLASTEEAIALTSAVTKGYGDTSAEAVQKASDLALETVRLGQTTFPELAASIGRVTPLAAELGLTQEELFGVMATGTGVTGGAAEVSTQLRGILQSLMVPTKDMAGLMGDLGYASGEAMLADLGLQGALQKVTDAAAESGEPLQKYISQIEAQTLALALTGPQATTFNEKMDEMQDVTGATDDAFRKQTEGINKNGFAMQKASSKAQVMGEKLGDGLAPALSKAIDAASPLIDLLVGAADGFSKLDPTVQTVIVTVALLAAGLGPLLIGLGMVLPALSGLLPVLATVGGAISGLALGPVALIAGAVALLAIAWTQNWGDIQGKTKAAVDFIMGLLRGLFDFVGSVLDRLGKVGEPTIGNTGASTWNEHSWANASSPASGKSSGGYNWDIPGLAEGGIVTRPTLALLGEGRHHEAVIPLDRMGGLGTEVTLNVIIPGMVVREDADINKLGQAFAIACRDSLTQALGQDTRRMVGV